VVGRIGTTGKSTGQELTRSSILAAQQQAQLKEEEADKGAFESLGKSYIERTGP